MHHHHHQQQLLFNLKTLTLSPSSKSKPRSQDRDCTSLLSDELLLRILSLIPDHHRDSAAAITSKRWIRLTGLLRRHLTLRSFASLDRLLIRFPNLTHLNLHPASFLNATSSSSSNRVLLSHGDLSIQLDPNSIPPMIGDCSFVDSDSVDRALEIVAKRCPNLCKLRVLNCGSGLVSVADSCGMIQELELHRCTDLALRSVSAFKNLRFLKLVGAVEGLYTGTNISDFGLTVLANGCANLVKLELSGCEGSYEGVSAIGKCCLMLEELTLTDHRMEAGWMAGLSLFGKLKRLRLLSCRKIDEDPGGIEELGSCAMMERLEIVKCQLRDKRSLRALFAMCESVREIVFQNCWGLYNEMFGTATICRRVELLSLEGCSQLTTEGLESVILSWSDLNSLTVVSCNKIKDDAVTPALSTFFSDLEEFKWRPNSKSILATSLAGTGMGKKGARFL